ncbi:hypothetical protein WR25_12448 [Diploscapter pachys]|uniref:Uncharacterized protein n=1 Tax=Diploscapter pachys TaxID=2018661 RepID=A0A2A2M3Q8_9BILA|nr:hypothetical protein WR25_12448 [Diploscapter pachys]
MAGASCPPPAARRASALPPQPGDEESVAAALGRQHPRQRADVTARLHRDVRRQQRRIGRIDGIVRAIGQEAFQLRLTLRRLEAARREDETPAGFHPIGGTGEQTGLQVCHLLDDRRVDAVEHVRMAAEDAGGAARRVDQQCIGRPIRRPFQHVGGDHLRLQPRAEQVLAQPLDPRVGHIDRSHAITGRGELQRLAAGRRAQIDRVRALGDPVGQQARGDGGGDILHPPAPLGKAGQFGHRGSVGQADMTRYQTG